MTTKRVFFAFAAEDIILRDFLVGQRSNIRSPFEFVDMSVKQPWDNDWHYHCRSRIKGCNGLIAIITNYSLRATGQMWEIQCAKEEGIPVAAIYGHQNERPYIRELGSNQPINWSWDNIKRIIDRF